MHPVVELLTGYGKVGGDELGTAVECCQETGVVLGSRLVEVGVSACTDEVVFHNQGTDVSR